MSGTPTWEDQQGQGAERARGPVLAPDMRLRRFQRITKSEDYRHIFDGGRSCVGDYMVMWLGASDLAHCRLGVVASKRSFRRAVDRARVKRMLREAFRLNRYRFTVGSDIVLIGRKKILKAPLHEIEGDLLRLAQSAGLLCDQSETAGLD